MLNILLLWAVKLAFVPVSNVYKSAIHNCDNNGSLSGILAFENSHDLTNLRAAPSIHVKITYAFSFVKISMPSGVTATVCSK